MKKIIIIILSIVILTGCSIEKIDDKNIDSIITKVLYNKNSLYNQHSIGYKYYLPKAVGLLENNDYNQILISDNNIYYLYIDITGYFYKAKEKYNVDNSAYYSKRLLYNKKNGYIEITKVNDKYFVELMFNYAKIESYVDKHSLGKMLSDSFMIVKSIKYNDTVINDLNGESVLNINEKTYNIYQPKAKEETFLDYIKEYDKYYDKDKELPDDDKINKKD